MPNEIIVEMESAGEIIVEMASAGEIIVEISGMTYQSVSDQIDALEAGKVDKVAGKGLSTEDYTTEEKTALNTTIPAQLAEKALKTEVGVLANLLTTDKASIVNAINELLNSKANKAQEAWITPTLSVVTPLSTPKYRKTQFNQIEIQMTFSTNTTGWTTIFTLPVGYRPSQVVRFAIPTDLAGIFITGYVDPAGAVGARLNNNASNYINLIFPL